MVLDTSAGDGLTWIAPVAGGEDVSATAMEHLMGRREEDERGEENLRFGFRWVLMGREKFGSLDAGGEREVVGGTRKARAPRRIGIVFWGMMR